MKELKVTTVLELLLCTIYATHLTVSALNTVSSASNVPIGSLPSSTNSSQSLGIHRRVKRTHGSCVAGLTLSANENAGDANILNTAANDGGGRGRGRGKRSSDRPKRGAVTFQNPFARYLARILRRPQRLGPIFITRTQARFHPINTNYQTFQLFAHSPLVLGSPGRISERFVADPHGVKCSQLCEGHGTLFALVGFCTPDYCRCAGDQWDPWKPQEEYSCNKHQIFDPVTLHCQDPRTTALCKDNLEQEGWGWKEPSYEDDGWK